MSHKCARYGVDNHRAALNERAVKAIRRNSHGWSVATRAEVYGVSTPTVYRVLNGETYGAVQ